MPTFQQQISARYDDTYCTAYDNYPTTTSATFGKIPVGKAVLAYNAFLRFLLNIPKNATITSAYLTLYSYEARIDDFIAQINFTNEDDAADFSTNPWGRGDGGTNVPWSVPDFPSPPNTVQTCDISSLIQAFINRAGYNENNRIAIRIKDGDATSGERQNFYQWDGNSAYAAILTVDYTVVVKKPIWECKTRGGLIGLRLHFMSTLKLGGTTIVSAPPLLWDSWDYLWVAVL